jgi:hypothetical protein
MHDRAIREALAVRSTCGSGFSLTPSDGIFTISATTPLGDTPSPPKVGSDNTIDSDGKPDSNGNSVASNVPITFGSTDIDFGFFVNQTVSNPGTGTPGYWKNHPEAWPIPGITIAGLPYIAWIRRSTGCSASARTRRR